MFITYRFYFFFTGCLTSLGKKKKKQINNAKISVINKMLFIFIEQPRFLLVNHLFKRIYRYNIFTKIKR